MEKRVTRASNSRRRRQTERTGESPEELARKLLEEERKAVEKAMDAIVALYGPALKELEKY